MGSPSQGSPLLLHLWQPRSLLGSSGCCCARCCVLLPASRLSGHGPGCGPRDLPFSRLEDGEGPPHLGAPCQLTRSRPHRGPCPCSGRLFLLFFFFFFLNWKMSDMIKVQEDLASGTVIKGGCFCSDLGFKQASPPTIPRAECQHCTSGTAAHLLPGLRLPTCPLFLCPHSPPVWPPSPAQWLTLPFWPMNSRMESISGFNPQRSLGCVLPGSVPLT